jgi:hypothetical protein
VRAGRPVLPLGRRTLAVLAVGLLGLAGGAAYAALAAVTGSGLHKPKITAGPAKLTNQTSAAFTYSTKETVDFLCSLDGGAYAPCGSGTGGSTAYAGPLADGLHRFQVEAQSGSSTSAPKTRTWTIDTVPPPSPVFAKRPPDTTTDTKARFKYRDAEPDARFACDLDRHGYAPCGSKKTYKHLLPGLHGFCVHALDKAGNSGPAACQTWSISASTADFSIVGGPLPGALLYPGGRTVPIDLVFTNPNPAPITLQSVTVSVTGTSALGCEAGWFTVVQQLTATPTVPAGSTKSLQDLGVAQANWPQLLMGDAGDQDACQNATVDLGFSGSAAG